MEVDPNEIDPPEATDDDRRKIARLANEQVALEDEVIEKTMALQDALRRLDDVRTRDLPAALEAVGLSKTALLDGRPIVLTQKYFAGQADTPEAIKYIEANGGAELVNCTITVSFDKKDRANAIDLMRVIREQPYANGYKSLEMTETVHHSTVSSLVNKLAGLGKNPPLALLKAYRRVTTAIGDRKFEVPELKGLLLK